MEPLARASFEFTLDDAVDVSWRLNKHLKSVRTLRLRIGLLAAVSAASVLLLLLWRTELSSAAIACWTILPSVVVFGSCQLQARAQHDRVARRILIESRGEQPGRCDVGLHADRIVVQQDRHTLVFPWTDVQSISEDQGDLEILARGGAIVVRARAFADEGERAAFLKLAMELAARATPGA